MENSDMPTYPIDRESYGRSPSGLTKREYFAGLAMQGLLASGPHDCDENGLAHDAVLNADALLKQLEKTK